jgi:hypothetical protein
MEYIQEIGEFIWAVVNNWAGYCTGGLIVALLWLWATIKQRALPRQIGIALAIIFLFFAVFNAWRAKDQQLRALKESLRSPVLEGGYEGLGVITATSPEGMVVIVNGVITNPHGPPTGIVNWKMFIKSQGRNHLVSGAGFPIGGKDIVIPLGPNDRTITLPIVNYWPRKTTQPIPAGGASEGWYIAIFKDTIQGDLHKNNATVVLEFADVASGNLHHLEGTINGTAPGGPKPPSL